MKIDLIRHFVEKRAQLRTDTKEILKYSESATSNYLGGVDSGEELLFPSAVDATVEEVAIASEEGVELQKYTTHKQ